MQTKKRKIKREFKKNNDVQFKDLWSSALIRSSNIDIDKKNTKLLKNYAMTSEQANKITIPFDQVYDVMGCSDRYIISAWNFEDSAILRVFESTENQKNGRSTPIITFTIKNEWVSSISPCYSNIFALGVQSYSHDREIEFILYKILENKKRRAKNSTDLTST